MKIGSVPYLNARPLVAWFEDVPTPEVEISYATPARLVEQLLAGAVDVAMVSTYALFEHPELHLLPGLGVTVAGAAWSVRLLSRTPITEMRTLALDAHSRSTTVLARIVLADRYNIRPTCLSLPPDRDAMLARADAAVLIGDIGLAVDAQGLIDLDLGAEWWALTGLPFYYAGWIARDRAALTAAAPLLNTACAYGLAHLEALAHREACRLHLPYDRCYRYLAEIMHYQTGDAEVAGLQEFRRRAAQLEMVA